MQISPYYDTRPYVSIQVSTDDFGDEVMAVSDLNPDIDMFQIKMNKETWWHLFDFADKVTDWRDGHDAE
jgi:hypothetical protein